MATMKCDHCDIGYPLAWAQCAACGGPLRNDGIANHDKNWKDLVILAQERIKHDREWEELTVPITAKVKETKGHFTIHSHDVVRSGVRHTLPMGTIIRLKDPDDQDAITFWEVQGYSYRKRIYWVQAFAVQWSTHIPEGWDGD